MLNEADRVRLLHIIDAARLAIEYAADKSEADLAVDPPGQALLVRSLEIIGEAASQMTPELRQSFPDVPWRQMIATRNRLIHGYFEVDHRIVWRTVQERLPELVAALERMLK